MITALFIDHHSNQKWEQTFNSPSEYINFVSHHTYLNSTVIEGEELLESTYEIE